jgi:hypothetical protein
MDPTLTELQQHAEDLMTYRENLRLHGPPPSAQAPILLTHPATASSSRSIARRAGTWQDQPLRTNSLRTPWIV